LSDTKGNHSMACAVEEEVLSVVNHPLAGLALGAAAARTTP
jgi:hypothetical protein